MNSEIRARGLLGALGLRGPVFLLGLVLIGCFLAETAYSQGAAIGPTLGTVDRTVAGAGSAISFSKQVAPILAQHCGECHISASKGRFSMASFARLTAARGVLVPGNPTGSKLVSQIESGKMPPKGDKLSPLELLTIKNWVKAGAAFDGNDRNAMLTSSSGGGSGVGPAESTPGGRGGSSRAPSGGSSSGYGSSSDYENSYDPESDYDPDDAYEDMYDEDMYGSGSGPDGRSGRRTVQSDFRRTYTENFLSALSKAEWSALFEPAPADLVIDSGPVLQRQSDQAFKAGNLPLALELAFGHMAAEYPESVVDLRTVKYSRLLRRPVWNMRFGVSMAVRSPAAVDPQPIRESDAGRRIGESPPGRRVAARGRRNSGYGDGGYGDDADYASEMMDDESSDDYGDDMYGDDMYGDDYGSSGRPRRGREPEAPKRTMLDPSAEEALDKTLGLVAEIVGEGFSTRFQNGDFGPLFMSVTAAAEPPADQANAQANNQRGGQPAGRPGQREEAEITLGPISEEMATLLDLAPLNTTMWRPGIVFIGEGNSSDQLLTVAKDSEIDLMLHFDVVLKPGRNETMQNISRCRIIHVGTGKSVIVSKGMDSREADNLASVGRQGERRYVEEQLANLFLYLDNKVKSEDLPPLTADVARNRVSTLMSSTKPPSLRTLAEIRLYHALQLINDSEVETAFDIIGGPEALVMLHGAADERVAMVHKWALRSLGVRSEP